jgi:iron complex transport system substrate-binding protein
MRARRSLPSTIAVLVAALALVACGSDDPGPTEAEDGPSGEAESSAASSAASPAVFPATVQHKFGETTVEEEPERVVSVGYTEHDTLLQLGVVPVAVTDWYGDQPFATWPWAQELLGDAEPEVLSLSDGFQYEKIAALQPDLIIGTNAGMTEEDYDLLSEIAPTVTSVEGSTQYFSSWTDQTLQIARALGREADGQAIIDQVASDHADEAAAHPEYADLTAVFSQGGPYDGILYVYPDGLSTDFLTDLGFQYLPGLQDYAPELGSQAEISAENVELIEADVVVFATESQDQFEELQGWATISLLPAVGENRAIYTDETLAGAVYFDTPLSRAYVLDRLAPMLELAVAGEAPREYPS